MLPRDARSKALAAAGLVFVACGIAGLWSLEPSTEPRRVSGVTPSDPPGSRYEPSAALLPRSTRSALVPPTPADAAAWSPRDPAALVARRFREAKDKRAFFEGAAAAGGGANLYFARVAATDCLMVSVRGMVGAEQSFTQGMMSTDPAYHDRLQAFRRQISGCRGFEAAPVTPAQLTELGQRLEELDDPIVLPRKLALLVAQASSGRETALELAKRLVADGDPFVIRQLPMVMASLRFGMPRYGDAPERRLQREAWDRESAAWDLASCALGFECVDSDGRSDYLCIWSAECGPINPEQVALGPIPAEQRSTVLERRDAIVQAIRAREWGALGIN